MGFLSGINGDPYKIILGAPRKAKAERLQIKLHKSLNRCAGSRAPEVMVKVTSFSCTKSDVSAHVDYVSRKGAVKMYNSMDAPMLKEEVTFRLHEKMDDQKVDAHGKTKRQTVNFILSMPQGTPPDKFRYATQDFLRDEFGTNNEYFYCFHDDSKSGTYHAHVIVAMEGRDHVRLKVQKEDLVRWRTDFADKLLDHDVLARATTCLSRDRTSKNVPTYKYHKNIGTVEEHGVAAYKWKEGAAESYYVHINCGKDFNGCDRVKTIWGKGLKQTMEAAEATGLLDQEIKIQKDEIKDRTVTRNIYSRDRKKIGTKDYTTTETTWKIVHGDDLKKELGLRSEVLAKTSSKYLKAWKQIHENCEKLKDTEAAKTVARIVKDHFGVDLTKNRAQSKNTPPQHGHSRS